MACPDDRKPAAQLHGIVHAARLKHSRLWYILLTIVHGLHTISALCRHDPGKPAHSHQSPYLNDTSFLEST